MEENRPSLPNRPLSIDGAWIPRYIIAFAIDLQGHHSRENSPIANMLNTTWISLDDVSGVCTWIGERVHLWSVDTEKSVVNRAQI
jgi:hypothetical protein